MLRDIQLQQGAVFEVEKLVPASFGNDLEALEAAQVAVALCDRSHWGRLQITDSDHLTFLHNQSTNDFKNLKPGEGCDTIFVTSTARTIDLATVYVLDEAVISIVSPNRREYLMTWLDRYIFFGDKVKLQDITDQSAMFSLVGPQSQSLLAKLGVTSLQDQPQGTHQEVVLAEQPVRVAVGSGLAIAGYTLIMNSEYAADVWAALVAAGSVPMGDRAWEQLRIQQGRPTPDQELTEDYNAVEACLWQAISLNKGCYIGQETIARLDTYKGVKQQLWGIRLNQSVQPGSEIFHEGEKVGILTSITQAEPGYLGLGYIRTKAGGNGLKVTIDQAEGELIEVPFLQRDRQPLE